MQFYGAVPTIKIDTENVVMPATSSKVSNVKVAEVVSPGSSNMPSLFQVMVIGPFAIEGFQLLVVILNTISVVPVFLR